MVNWTESGQIAEGSKSIINFYGTCMEMFQLIVTVASIKLSNLLCLSWDLLNLVDILVLLFKRCC